MKKVIYGTVLALAVSQSSAYADVYVAVDASGNAVSGAIVCDAATCGAGSQFSQLTLQPGQQYVLQGGNGTSVGIGNNNPGTTLKVDIPTQEWTVTRTNTVVLETPIIINSAPVISYTTQTVEKFTPTTAPWAKPVVPNPVPVETSTPVMDTATVINDTATVLSDISTVFSVDSATVIYKALKIRTLKKIKQIKRKAKK